jgi:hypothetical protein
MKTTDKPTKKSSPDFLMFSKTKERTANNLIIYNIMKKFIGVRILAMVLIASVGMISCSKNDGSDESVSGNAKVSNYLKFFYNKDFQLGKSVDTKIIKATSAASKSEEVDNLIVTEVFVGEDTTARGYIITNKSTNEFLYFIDVDRINYKMTSVKIDVNDSTVFNDINEFDKYASTNGFDLIKVAEQVNAGIIANNKFWGWGSWQPMGPCTNGHVAVVRHYHVFWLETSILDYDVQPC